jgi:hypothetical protein
MIPYALQGTIRFGPFRSGRCPSGRRPVHPAACSVRELIPGRADTTVVCPRCPVDGDVVTILDHLLEDHGSDSGSAAEWLETVDGDLFALAVHCLISGSHTAQPSNTRST